MHLFPLTASLRLFYLLLLPLPALASLPLAGQVSVLPLRGEVRLDRGEERPDRIRGQTSMQPGESLETGSASAAIVLLPSGARMALQSESKLTLSPLGSTANANTALVPLFVLEAGFVVARVPREAAAEDLHIRTEAGVFVIEVGTAAVNLLYDRSGQRVIMAGVEAGRMRLQPAWEGGSTISLFQGDAYTFSRFPASAGDPPPQVQEQILVGDLRSRLLAAVEDIESGQAEVAGSQQRGRPTRAVTSLPRADHLPRPYPATGKMPPEELLR